MDVSTTPSKSVTIINEDIEVKKTKRETRLYPIWLHRNEADWLLTKLETDDVIESKTIIRKLNNSLNLKVI